MKTVVLSAAEALRLNESGGYTSLRADEPTAVVVEFGSEGAVLRDAEMQLRITSLFSPQVICSLAPLPVVEACVCDRSKSVHAGLQGYYGLSAVIVSDVMQAKRAIQGAGTWLRDFPRETVTNMNAPRSKVLDG